MNTARQRIAEWDDSPPGFDCFVPPSHPFARMTDAERENELGHGIRVHIVLPIPPV